MGSTKIKCTERLRKLRTKIFLFGLLNKNDQILKRAQCQLSSVPDSQFFSNSTTESGCLSYILVRKLIDNVHC